VLAVGLERGEGRTYSTAVEHGCSNLDLGRKAEAFSLQGAICFVNVAKRGAASSGSGPGLDQIEDPRLDLVVQGSVEERDQIVHELTRGNLLNKVLSAVLYTRIGETESSQLDVWVLVGNPPFERAHGLLGRDGLASDQVCDFQVEGNVLQAARCCSFDLLVHGRRAGTEPRRHLVLGSLGTV
jgi:hypothetical protein